MYKKFTIIYLFDLFFYNLEIESSQSFKIVLNDRNIIFYTNQVDNIGKKYRNFARKNMQEYIEKVIENFYPIIRKYNKPKIFKWYLKPVLILFKQCSKMDCV